MYEYSAAVSLVCIGGDSALIQDNLLRIGGYVSAIPGALVYTAGNFPVIQVNPVFGSQRNLPASRAFGAGGHGTVAE